MIHNIFVFHGSDHKVGTTMTAQSLAELIAENNTEIRVLLAFMNGRVSREYFTEDAISIDSMKHHIDNKTMNGKEFIKDCKHKGNLYIICGIVDEIESRYYHPEMAEYFLEEVSSEFDIIIVDSGSEIDNGLAVGAMKCASEIYLLSTQQESSLRRIEKKREILHSLNLNYNALVINKHDDNNLYGVSYICERINHKKDKVLTLSYNNSGLIAETEERTLLNYKNDSYERDIAIIANDILNKIGHKEISIKRKSKWKSFI